MSYLVLARKYRPKTFAEVIGQEVVTRVLTGALEEERIGHAYLFAGPRGTGKTTIARIFAKCLNCLDGPTASPCGTCDRCTAADSGTEVDIIELDAASHTGVDTIRELRDETAYAPMRARYKVYLIDEVHMLSKGAFNALLKTLEEPPPHVVFLFATTEPHRVLDTILSRCQVLRLSALSEERIVSRLAEVFGLEGVKAGEGVVEEMAKSARGGMRDALSLADKLLALAGNEPTLEDLHRLGGEGGARAIAALLGHMEEGDRPGLLRTLAGYVGDEGELVSGLLASLRTSLLLFHCGEDVPVLSASAEERAASLERARRVGPDRIEVWMQELLRARERMRLLQGEERLILEVTLLDLARPEETVPLGELITRLEALEGRVGQESHVGSGAQPGRAAASPAAGEIRPAPPAVPERSAPPAPTSSAPAASPAPARAPARPASVSHAASPSRDDGFSLRELWTSFLPELRKTHGALASLLDKHVTTADLRLGGEHVLLVPLGKITAGEARLVGDKNNHSAATRALSRVAGDAWKVEFKSSQDEPAPQVAAQKAPGAPAAKKRDAFTQEVADLFGGVIEDI